MDYSGLSLTNVLEHPCLIPFKLLLCYSLEVQIKAIHSRKMDVASLYLQEITQMISLQVLKKEERNYSYDIVVNSKKERTCLEDNMSAITEIKVKTHGYRVKYKSQLKLMDSFLFNCTVVYLYLNVLFSSVL